MWYHYADLTYFMIEGNVNFDETDKKKVQRALRNSHFEKARCILPVVAWRLNK